MPNFKRASKPASVIGLRGHEFHEEYWSPALELNINLEDPARCAWCGNTDDLVLRAFCNYPWSIREGELQPRIMVLCTRCKGRTHYNPHGHVACSTPSWPEPEPEEADDERS